jgi:hypothetical protein
VCRGALPISKTTPWFVRGYGASLLKEGSLSLIDTELRQSVTEAAKLRSVGAFSRSFQLVHDSLESLQIVHLGKRIESQSAENRN